MKLLAVSDNHGDRYILTELIDIYHDEVDGMIHCGDSELRPSDSVWESMVTVRGNMDFTDSYPVTRIETFSEPVFVTHGHLHRVKMSLAPIVNEAKQAGARFAFYGHTHVPAIDYQDGVWVINPGSIAQPRGQNHHKTYAIIDVTGPTGTVRYFDDNHNEVKSLGTSLFV